MSARGPGDVPAVVRRRARRNRKPPITASVQQATRGAAPLSAKPVRPKRVQRPPSAARVQQQAQNARPLSQRPVRPKQVVRPLAQQQRAPRVTTAAPPEGVRDVRQIQRGAAVNRYDQLTGKQKHQQVSAAQRRLVSGKADESDKAILHAHATRVAGNQKRVDIAKTMQAITGTTPLGVAQAGRNADERAAKAARHAGIQTSGPAGGALRVLGRAVEKAAETIAPAPTAALKLFHIAGGKDKQLAAPALAALDQSTRAGNAVRTSLKHDIQHGGVKEAFIGVHAPGSKAAEERRRATSRGFALKERTSGADVLKAAGVKGKAARAVGGLAVDVATDSATTPSFGLGGAAAREGEKVAARVVGKAGTAARRAEREAARQAAARGASRAERKQAAGAAGNAVRTQVRARAQQEARDVTDVGLATRRSEAAHRQLTNATTSGASAKRIQDLKRTAEQAEKRVKRARKAAPRTNRGLTVRALGREVPGVRVATAAVARGGRKALRRVPAKTEAARRTEREFLQTERTARATRNEGQARAVRAATIARHGITDDEFEKVAHALDRGDLGSLTPSWRKALKTAKGDRKAAREIMKADHADELRLANTAHDVRSALSHGYQQARRAGAVKATEPENFLTKADRNKLKRSIESQRKAAIKGTATARARQDADALAKHQGRRAAVETIPARGRGAGVPLGETHQAWLGRVQKFAQDNNLPMVRKRAEKLLAKTPKDVARGYFPREYEERALKSLGIAERKDFDAAKAVRGGQRRTVKTPTAGFARTDVRPLEAVQKDLRAAGKPEFTTNVPLATAGHVREMARAASEAGFARDLAHRFGRKVSDPSDLKEGESLYKLGTVGGKGYGLHPARSIPKTGKSGGQYVALKDDVVNRMQQEIQAIPRVDSKALRAWDKTTAGFKTLAISNPAFYIRNAIGDITRLAEMPGNPIRNIANLRQGVQGVRAVRQAERFHQAPGKVLKSVPLDQTIRIAGKQVPARDFVNRARSHGLIDAGFHGREQAELFHPERAFGDIRGGRHGSEMLRQIHKPLTIDRENATRLAAFKAGLDMGLSDHEAADLAHRFFVDYGRLSPAERIYARRALPFYTWTARSLPVTVKNWTKNPARYGNLEMAREEWNQAVTGLSEDEIRSQMSPGTQRQIPFVIPLGGGRFAAVSASWPANLLNLVPTGLGGKAAVGYGQESLKTTAGLLHPGLRDFIELTTGRNPITKREVESPTGPMTAAPDWVRYLPEDTKRALQVTDQYVDKRTGKKTLAWRGWADWVWRQVPGGPQQISAAAEGGRPGQTKGAAATIAGLLGARVDDMGPEIAKYSAKIQGYKKQADINKKLSFLRARGIDHDHPNAEYLKLREQANALDKQLNPRKKKASGKLDIGLGGTSGPKVDIGLGQRTGPKIDIGLGG
jgi:hypothetical protein